MLDFDGFNRTTLSGGRRQYSGRTCYDGQRFADPAARTCMDEATFRSVALDQRTQGVSFDLYERYSIAAYIVRLLREPASCSVLDIGGHSPVLWPGFESLAAAFITDARIFVTDLHREPGLRNYAIGSGMALPFADRSFDFVLAQDTLEHIPSTDRETFIKELIRVSDKAVLLTFPFLTPLNTSCDKLVYRFIQVRKNLDQPALSEHLELGLPDLATVHQWITQTGFPFSTWTHGNALTWLQMMMTKSHLWAQGVPELEEVLDSVFNASFAAGDYSDPCYRAFVLIAKKGSVEKVLERVNQFRGQPHSPADRQALYSLCETVLGSTCSVENERRSQHSINLVQSLGGLLTEAVHSQRQQLVDREIRLAEKSSQAEDASIRLAEATSRVAHYENLLDDLRQQVADLQIRLAEKSSQAEDASIRLAEATSRAAHYENLLDDLRQQVADLQTRFADATSQAEHNRKLADAQQQRLADAAARLEEAKSIAVDCEQRDQQHCKQIAELERQLARGSAAAQKLIGSERLSRIAAEKELGSLKTKSGNFLRRLFR